MENKVLHLNLKRKWFDMFIQEIEPKTEEYREIKFHWIPQLFNFKESPNQIATTKARYVYAFMLGVYKKSFTAIDKCLEFKYLEYKKYDSIVFSNGMTHPIPRFEIELKSISIDTGKKEWGATPGVKYFVLKTGKILWRKNI